MKLTKHLGILSSASTIGLVLMPICSCSNTYGSNNLEPKNFNVSNNKNLKIELSNPKDKYGIDKVVKINGDEVYQNVFRFRTNEADSKGGRNLYEIEAGAFQGNKQLQHVSYSYEDDDSSVKLSTIEKGSFQACQNLETIKIPSSCTTIEERAFFRCEKLNYIDLSSFDTIEKINSLTFGTDAFRGIAETGQVVFNSNLVELAKQETTEGAAALAALRAAAYNLREQGVPDCFFNADYVIKIWNWKETDSAELLNEKWKTLAQEAQQGSDVLKEIYGGADLIGKSAYVNINGLNHAVRIIGIDHDNLANDTGKATLTFEFVNPICDDKGYSLGTLFNNVVQDTTNASRKYTSSTLRNNLDRNCETSTTATRWYQKGITHQSDGTDNTLNLTDKTALDMIKDNNTNLYNSIVPVTKNVATSTDSGSTFTISPYDAKLFVNTAVESFEDLGNYEYAKGGNTYEYWKKNTDKLNHVVKDIANKSGGSYFYEEVVGTDAANSWCMNWAGVNMATDQTGGCFRWTSSSGVDDNHSFWISGYGSCISNTESGGAMLDNYSITPCFCIGQTLPTITTTSWEDFITDVNKIYSNEQTAKEFAQHYTIWNSTTKSIEQATEIENLVGQQRFIKINNLDHRVRIIGTQHDTLSKSTVGSTSAVLTFQFAQLISDSTGHSLATTWNGDGSSSATNYDYRTSNLFNVMEGESDVTWYERASTSASTTYKSSVLKMLPSVIQTNLKEVIKKVGVSTDSGSTYTSTEFNSKVFPIAYCEMTATSSSYAKSDEGTLYSYWASHDSVDGRVIKQVKDGNVVYTTSVTVRTTSGTLTNWAGYNYKSDQSGGGYNWLRSPNIKKSSSGTYAWRNNRDGNLLSSATPYSLGYMVAPCFCI